jgi:hypothetical protein
MILCDDKKKNGIKISKDSEEVVVSECSLFAVASVRFGGELDWTRQSACGQQEPKARVPCVL